jgi:hypothetical protein
MTMLWFQVQVDSWWSSISFKHLVTTAALTAKYQMIMK